ncbi:CPBP family intramembrane glutamic endopeptidase [Arthrobacter sp. TB 26]|uniref:CPBP family intramembrane glutamic endopeptidase n=1 Tax=Arthrobacter sp. TB 26 TaxID=494420 RepID=UPI0004298937|nr:CPBP family intramembrane glutamic endopeptidase [Arthrobacter sp. TB 26]
MTITASPTIFRGNIIHALKLAAASRCAWFFAAVWLASVLVLGVGGHDIPAAGIVVGSVLLLLSLLVTGATEPAMAVIVVDGPARRRVWAHLGLVAVFIALTGWNNLAFHNVIDGNANIPLWTPLVEWLQRLGEQWFGESLGNFVANPVTYVLIPLVVLLLAGARLSTLGFGKGHRVGRALLICCAMPLVWFTYTLISGQLTIVRLLGSLASNVMQNGFLEEFLFRGILQTRLRLLAGPGWALVLQALVFGVWHLGSGFANTGHAGLLPAIAVTIVQQSLIGLALGILFERTRNLLVPSVVHIALNSMS